MWSHPETARTDTYMVDGRFRVACFMQVMLLCPNDALVVIHDFSDRSNFAPVHQVAREIAWAGNLSAFVRRQDFDTSVASNILDQHHFDAGSLNTNPP